MGLIYSNIKTQESLGTGLGTIRDDLNIDFTAHIIRDDVFALKDEVTAATIQNLVDKITSVQLSTVTGQPESTIDADDLWETDGFLGYYKYWSILTSTDDIPHGFSLAYPLSPFMLDPTRNFGTPAGKLTQYILNTIADVNQDFDGYTHDLTLEGLSVDLKGAPMGYMRTVQDTFTSGAVGSTKDTEISGGKRLLATKNFETTSFDDLAAAAAFNVTGIREQSVAFSDEIKYGPYREMRNWVGEHNWAEISATAGAAESWGQTLSRDHFFIDFGWMNDSAQLGINIQGQPVKIKTVAGVASEATRVNAWYLV